MDCHLCENSFSTVPALKRHLEQHFEKLRESQTSTKRKLKADQAESSKRTRLLTGADDEEVPVKVTKPPKPASDGRDGS